MQTTSKHHVRILLFHGLPERQQKRRIAGAVRIHERQVISGGSRVAGFNGLAISTILFIRHNPHAGNL